MNHRKKEFQSFIDKTYKELKDFQRLTVDFVYEKFYLQKRNKFLVADEVGLGKTIVAKGLIAKAFESFRPTKKNPTFNVIYICSNQALAQENLKKLNFTNENDFVEDPLNRLIYLAFKQEKNNSLLKFDSLTPATSLNISNRSGSKKERAVLFALLSHYAPFKNRKNGLKWLLKGGVNIENWNIKTQDYHAFRKEYFKPEIFKKFRKVLFETKISADILPNLFAYLNEPKGMSFWNGLLKLCSDIGNKNYHLFYFKNEVIVQLRHLLTKICLEYLSADLIILDEFQRYAEILGTKSEEKISPAIELAQAVFELKNTKILMLSATPFKPYTTRNEEGNELDHYSEFQRVLKFLMKKQGEEFWIEFQKDRREFFNKIINPKDTLLNLDSSIKLKNKLEKTFKECMIRTERNKVSEDQNVLIKSAFNKPLPISAEDVNDFIVFDNLIQRLKQKHKLHITSPIEYSKSSPFPLSFLDDYQLKKNLDEYKEDEEVKKYLKEFKAAWISLDEVNEYKALGKGKDSSIVPNAKMQWLINQLNDSDSWKWLWVPPTINYYTPKRIFPEQTDFCKTLIFSSWKMVPRSISTILSYEAERMAMNAYNNLTKSKEREPYFADKSGKRRKPTPILSFKKKSGTNENASMSLFTLIYPSKYLSDLYDPESNITDKFPIDTIIKNLAKKIEIKFNELDLSRFIKKNGESERWYWAAPILLDKFIYSKELNFEDLIVEMLINDSAINSNSYRRGEDISGSIKDKHLDELSDAFEDPNKIRLGAIPKNLFNILSLICLSSPANCFLRSLNKSIKNADYQELFGASFSYGISKIHFFNKPDNIAIVKSTLSENSDSYWLSVINYCLEGNLQSSLDEYIHLLVESGKDLDDIISHFSDVLSLTTSRIKVDDLASFMRGQTKRMRVHYAVDFGTQDLETESGTGRIINVRQAFNSPYRPFILTSTSIGQEGLDFHYYCGRVMHWNLPGNAIDIEQREGRVNRYKGLIIRKNVVRKYLKDLKRGGSKKTLWHGLFDIALVKESRSKNKCELVPFWHVEPVDDIKIKRIVPIYPFSRDIQKYRTLIDTLTFYRLTFGQPRQEELVETLQQSGLSMDEIKILKKNLLIDLSP